MQTNNQIMPMRIKFKRIKNTPNYDGIYEAKDHLSGRDRIRKGGKR